MGSCAATISRRVEPFLPKSGGCSAVPAGDSSEEFEDYRVNLNEVTTLELTIQPEITAGNAVATLACWRIA
jgi:hypothetical protein